MLEIFIIGLFAYFIFSSLGNITQSGKAIQDFNELMELGVEPKDLLLKDHPGKTKAYKRVFKEMVKKEMKK